MEWERSENKWWKKKAAKRGMNASIHVWAQHTHRTNGWTSVSYASTRRPLFAITHTQTAVKWAIFRSNFIFQFFPLLLLLLFLPDFIAFSTVFWLSDIMINDFITRTKRYTTKQKVSRRQNKHRIRAYIHLQTENRIIIILFMNAFCLSVAVGKAAREMNVCVGVCVCR